MSPQLKNSIQDPSEVSLLNQAEEAFDQGNYHLAHQLTQRSSSETSEARARKERLEKQLETPALTRYLLLLTFLLLVCVTLSAYF